MAAATESTVGTAETLAVGDGAFNAYDLDIQPEIDSEEREGQGSFDYLSQITGPRGCKFTFKTDIGWDGADMPNWASILLPACGWVESSQVYTPRSEAPGSNVKTLTMGLYQNGLLFSLAGAMGNFKINARSGRIIYIEWEFTGVWQTPTDTAIIAPTYPTDVPLRFSSATITHNSVAQCVETMMFDAGNEVIYRECPNTAAGYVSALVVNRYPKITINPEAQLVATEPRFTTWLNHTEQAFSCAFDGPEGGTSNGAVTLAAPKAQIINISKSDRNKLLVDEVELACNKNGANLDECASLTFTDAVA